MISIIQEFLYFSCCIGLIKSTIKITNEKPTNTSDCLHYYKAKLVQANTIAADSSPINITWQQNKHNTPLFTYTVYLQALLQF